MHLGIGVVTARSRIVGPRPRADPRTRFGRRVAPGNVDARMMGPSAGQPSAPQVPRAKEWKNLWRGTSGTFGGGPSESLQRRGCPGCRNGRTFVEPPSWAQEWRNIRRGTCGPFGGQPSHRGSARPRRPRAFTSTKMRSPSSAACSRGRRTSVHSAAERSPRKSNGTLVSAPTICQTTPRPGAHAKMWTLRPLGLKHRRHDLPGQTQRFIRP